MVVGLLVFELDIPASRSLKDKRQVIRSVQARLRNEFNISVAEVDLQNQRQRAVIAVACVSTSRDYAHGLLTKVVDTVENSRLDCVLADYSIEMI